MLLRLMFAMRHKSFALQASPKHTHTHENSIIFKIHLLSLSQLLGSIQLENSVLSQREIKFVKVLESKMK